MQAKYLFHHIDIGKRYPLLQNAAPMVPHLKSIKQSKGVIVSGTQERQILGET